MTNPAAAASSVSLLGSLWGVARTKFQLRWIVVLHGMSAGIFWTAAVIGAGWLRHFRLNYLVVGGLVAWSILALPMLYVQLSLIVDMLGYVFTGRITFFPLVIALSDARSDDERDEIHRALLPPLLDPRVQSNLAARVPRFWRIVVGIIDVTSPLSCLSTWALVVLVRIPASAHLRVANLRRVGGIQREARLRVYSQALARLSAL